MINFLRFLRPGSGGVCAWLIVVFGFATPVKMPAEGTVNRFAARLWQVEEGLPHNVVRAVVQTRDGYLWVGTYEGLARFDGVRFKTLEHPLLASLPVTALFEAPDGVLWIGAETGLFRLGNGVVNHYTTADGLPDNAIRAVGGDATGEVWVACTYGLARVTGGTIQKQFEEWYRDDTIWTMHVDEEGGVWTLGPHVLYHSERGTVQLSEADGLIAGGLRSIAPARDGGMWIGTSTGMSHFKDGKFRNFPKGRGPSAFVNAFCETSQGDLWVGTYEGLSRFRNGEFIEDAGLQGTSHFIHSISEDREGNVWMGSDEGLTRWTQQRFVTFDRRDGLTHNRTRALVAAPDGVIWIGVWGGGLHRLDGGKLTSSPLKSASAIDYIYSMQMGRDDSLWLGMDYAGGLAHVRGEEVTRYGHEQGLDAHLIPAILEDREGRIWAGSDRGLFRLSDGKVSHFPTGISIEENWINALYEGRDGHIWVGTEAGLGWWDEEAQALHRQTRTSVLSIYEDADQVLWVGTRGQGLQRMKDGEIRTFTTRDGLGGNSISAILEDDQNFFWIHGGRGIFRVSRDELNQLAADKITLVTSINHGRTDGVVSSGQYRYASQPTAVKDRDGRLWFRTSQGVVAIDPRNIRINALAPPVLIEQVIADKAPQKVFPAGNRSEANEQKRGRRDAGSRALVIPPGRGELEIHYTALSFAAPEKNRFRFRLDGIDTDWREAGNRRVAYYSALRPGTYTFRVVASNNDGVWNETGAQLAIIWRPHFWETWWFYGLVGLSAALAVGGAVRYLLLRRHRRNLLYLEQQNAIEKERTRIAQDMHDQLGANLTEIGLLTELAKRNASKPADLEPHLAQISERSREVAQTIDEIIWAVNPRNDNLPRLAAYIVHYADELFDLTSIQCRLHLERDLPERELAAEVRHNIFLAVREALNNIVNHSQASEVQVQLAMEGGDLHILIEDNGQGFLVEELSENGDGLENMKRRIETVKGRFSLMSRPGGGTRIEFRIPVEVPGEAPVLGRST